MLLVSWVYVLWFRAIGEVSILWTDQRPCGWFSAVECGPSGSDLCGSVCTGLLYKLLSQDTLSCDMIVTTRGSLTGLKFTGTYDTCCNVPVIMISCPEYDGLSCRFKKTIVGSHLEVSSCELCCQFFCFNCFVDCCISDVICSRGYACDRHLSSSQFWERCFCAKGSW